jgi:kinesin family protein 3/17
LLKPESVNLVVREDKRRGVHVEGLSEWVVRSPAGAARRRRRLHVAGSSTTIPH